MTTNNNINNDEVVKFHDAMTAQDFLYRFRAMKLWLVFGDLSDPNGSSWVCTAARAEQFRMAGYTVSR